MSFEADASAWFADAGVHWFHEWLLDEGYVPDGVEVVDFLSTQTGIRRRELFGVCAATDGWQEAAEEAYAEHLSDRDAERREFDAQFDTP